MRTLTPLAVPALLLAACASTPKPVEPPSPLASVERFYAAPVVYDFEEPADWELPAGEWDEKTSDFSEAWVSRLEVTRRAPISRLQGDLPAGGAAIQLIVREVDLGFFAGIVRKPAICKGELLISTRAEGVIRSWEVDFRTPDDAGWQWYTWQGAFFVPV